MRKAFKYLSQHCSSTPIDVDRLIVSAFVSINEIQVAKNKLLCSYLISNEKADDFNNLQELISILKKEVLKFDIESLIELFEFVISPSDRIVNGAVYTPSYIREYILNRAFAAKKDGLVKIKIADISCGCGGFLFTAAVKLKNLTGLSFASIFENNIFGLDIQEYSINRTKLLLSLLAIMEGEDVESFNFNLFQGDSLDFKWEPKIIDFNGFDVIAGNPPYVCARNLDVETREKLKNWEVSKSGNSDLYIPFFQIAIESLSLNGFLGYITMNSFFKSLNGRALREYFKKNKYSFSIIDFGSEQVFKSKNTYTCLCFIENKRQDFISYASINSQELNHLHTSNEVSYNILDSKKGWNLKDNILISKIESTGIPFGELYQTRHGIATLKNDIYIFRPVYEDEKYYYLQNGSLYKIEKGICKDIVNSNKLSREISLNKLKEKVIFPYDHHQKPKLLPEDLLKKEYPEALKYFQNKRELLEQRDKGNGNYENWFAFGRTQSLEKIKNKMFFPKYSDRTPNFIINSDDDLLFYNGLAVVGSSNIEMEILKKVMESSVFWYYIKSTSKPYSSNYYSLNGNYIRNFGVCNLNNEEIKFVLKENDRSKLDNFFEEKYNIRVGR